LFKENGIDDLLSYSAWLDEGETIIQFSRLLDTGDIWDKPITDKVMKAAWAYHTTDPIVDDIFPRHVLIFSYSILSTFAITGSIH